MRRRPVIYSVARTGIAISIVLVLSRAAAALGATEGEWQGTGSTGNAVGVYTISLMKDGDGVKGTFQVGSSRAYPVEGTVSGSTISLKFIGHPNAYINASLSDDGG
jgi:hypothetical protein